MRQTVKRWFSRSVSCTCAAAFGVLSANVAFAKPPGMPAGSAPRNFGMPERRAAAPFDGAARRRRSKTWRQASTRANQSRRRQNRACQGTTETGHVASSPELERADRRLLMQEIARLEELVKVTPAKSPDRPMLLLRLAGAYSELRSISEHD